MTPLQPADRDLLAAEFVAAQRREEKRPRGFVCPNGCRVRRRPAPLTVYSTRRLPDEVIRVRLCPRCKVRVYTSEQPL